MPDIDALKRRLRDRLFWLADLPLRARLWCDRGRSR